MTVEPDTLSGEHVMNRTEEFERLRPLLFSIAYRILGSVTEAEDVVQEAWLRSELSTTEPESPRAFLTTVVTRLSIDVLRSARVRRESYVGPWFPEPLLADPYQDPERQAELDESVSMATLVLLERLGPLERAVFVLREVFGFGFGEIADVVQRSEAACRQTAVRARRHVQDGWPRFEADRRERDRLAARFLAAFRNGDVEELRDLLAADAQLIGDGGGKAPQVAAVFSGADDVARILLAVAAQGARIGSAMEPQLVNGEPGAVFRDADGNVINTWALEIASGRVRAIRAVLNPEKLAHLGPVADAWKLVRRAGVVLPPRG
jgi:RNA polymerase sigma-70 factor (ECF subfamily)